MTANRWIIPFKGRNTSGTWDLNFLYQHGRTYIMDNHSAALWCWLQQISLEEKYNLIHIDWHYDLATGDYFESQKKALPGDLQTLTIAEYLNISYKVRLPGSGTLPVIKCDNYLSLFLDLYPNIIETCLFATHNEYHEEFYEDKELIDPFELPHSIVSALKQNKNRWIVNIDLDYFFFPMQNDKPFDDDRKPMFSDIYIQELFSAISKSLNDGSTAVLTIALSPEYSGDWESAEKLCNKVCRVLEIPFSLPA